MTEYPPGLILLDKPENITSFNVLGSIKKKINTRKVGHCGTLDRFASGLLLVLTGRYTKLNPYFTGLDKHYRGIIRFGMETDTLDPTGEEVARGLVPDEDTISAALKNFVGSIQQIPPRFSAVHIEGERSHKKARKGEVFDPPARRVTVYSVTPESFTPPDLNLSIHCSSGTYIRSIARDLGRACGSYAHLATLRRTAVGSFRVEDAVKPEDFAPAGHLRSASDFLKHLNGFDTIVVRDSRTADMRNGLPPESSFFTREIDRDGEYACLDSTGELVALFNYKSGKFRYLFVNR